MTASGASYAAAGVDVEAGERAVALMRSSIARAQRPEVVGDFGGFAGLFDISAFTRFRRPLLATSTDGVGTKIAVARALDIHDTIGIDLVAMSVNDILVQGAEPLFFLDYYACGKLDVDVAARVVGGIAKGCELSGCALIGGETAEMPGMYAPGEYDLAGFAVGVVEKSRIIDGKSIAAGDCVIGLASSGPHSNGYSLVRRIVADRNADLSAPIGDASLGDALMAPTRIYVRSLLDLMRHTPVKGMAHITGGGLTENVPRILPAGMQAVLQTSAWTFPPVFDWLQQQGNVALAEMHRTFNCGIGMVVVVASGHAEAAVTALRASGEVASIIGEIRAAPHGGPQTILVP